MTFLSIFTIVFIALPILKFHVSSHEEDVNEVCQKNIIDLSFPEREDVLGYISAFA